MGYAGKTTEVFSLRFSPWCGEPPERERTVEAMRNGRIITAPHFKGKAWGGYPLAATLARRLGKPARLLNDAEVQGLGIVKGRGLEVVLTLGTGVGSAVFSNGALTPHLELAHPRLHDQLVLERGVDGW